MKRYFALGLVASTLAAPAFADSSVTLYGRLNVTVERQKTGDVVEKTLQDNASRIGFKGTEDLGGGMTAGFQIEHGFDITTGKASSSAFWSRQAEANLAGSFGMVRLGRFTSEAYFASADYVSMHNHDTGKSSDALYADANGFNGSGKVSYRTPKMGGFWAEAAAQNATSNNGNKVARGYDLAANYDLGALHLGGGYTKHDEAKTLEARALFELGAFTFGGYVQRATDLAEDQVSEEVGLGHRTVFRLSGMYTLGATELHLNVGHAGNTGGISDTGATQFTVGVNQNLSKRTKIYAFYTKVNNQASASYLTGDPGVDFGSVAVGVRHNF